MKKTIITIGRELGSGGRTIGKMVAEKLNIPYYDRELIDKAAGESGLSTNFVENNDQRVTNSFLYNVAMGTSYGYGILQGANQQTLPLGEQVYIAQQKVIEEYANKGSCVIVGRCADQILAGRDDLLRVFIYSDMEKRKERGVKEYGMSQATVARDIKKSDKERSQHYNMFTDQVWGDRHNYDLMLNSGDLGFQKCVNIICQMAEL